MKTAIYIEDSLVQLVLTPENKFEENALNAFRDKPLDAKIFAGAFYDCRGGWTRQTAFYQTGVYDSGDDGRDHSLILVARTGE